MRIARLTINEFRGVREATLLFPNHCVLVGDNNVGKSTVIEAIDLVLGPERLYRKPPIDEHDFFAGEYLNSEGESKVIFIEVVVVDLNEDQQARFRNNIEWWDTDQRAVLNGPPESLEKNSVLPALRIQFEGRYDLEEDDFLGNTYFAHPVADDEVRSSFSTKDKRFCGFLFLRTLRTGSRALSLERGSLLDIIIRLREDHLHMWEDVLVNLRSLDVATGTEEVLPTILEDIQKTLRKYVPMEWADQPHLRVSDLTRESLRKILTVFMNTIAVAENDKQYAAPIHHQGTGTINLLVLALLAMIAELKQNVIFAMEEPEIAIPPYTQKQIVVNLRTLSSQSIFTSHSPYVLEEFSPSEVMVLQRDKKGIMNGQLADLPPAVKAKAYRQTLRQGLCEGLLARRVALVEGHTEYSAWPLAARHLAKLDSARFKSFERLGVAVINAGSDSQIAPLGEYYLKLGKEVFALYDKQEDQDQKLAIEAITMNCFEAPEKGFENVVLNGVKEKNVRSFATKLIDEGSWPQHLISYQPTPTTPIDEVKKVLLKIFKRSKGEGELAQLLLELGVEDMPTYITSTLESILNVVTQKMKIVKEDNGEECPDETAIKVEGNGNETGPI